MTLGTIESINYARLGALIRDRIQGARLEAGGELHFPCPLCNGPASLFLAASEDGDAVWCNYSCADDSVVERALRFLVARLPALCSAHDGYPNKHCARCQNYNTALAHAFRQLRRGEADQTLTTEGQTLLTSLVDAEPVPDPTILRLPDGTYLLRRAWVHLFHGKPFCGKTPLTYLAIVEVVQAGGVALLIDYEMGASGAKALLMELGLSSEQIRQSVLYAYNPSRWTQDQRDRLLAEIEERCPDLVVVDSLSRSMAVAGLDQNDATETDAWFHSLATWAADQFGSAVVLIDHTTRTDGPHPSGSIQKTAAPQFHIWVQNTAAFSRNHEDGCSLLVVQKDRSGQRTVGASVAELRTQVGGSFVLRDVGRGRPVAKGDDVEIEVPEWAVEEQAHIDALRASGSTPMTRRSLVGDGGAANKARRDGLDRLVSKGLVIERKQPGSAKGRHYWLAEFFQGGPVD